MKKALLVVGFCILPAMALAQVAHDTVTVAPSPSTVINVGAVVTAVLSWARDLLIAAAGLAVTVLLPLPVRVFVTNAMLERAVDYAIAQVEGAAKGKTLDVTTANSVLNEAIAYVITLGPSMAKRLGENLKPMLLARLSAKVTLPEATNVPVAVPSRNPAGNGNVIG